MRRVASFLFTFAQKRIFQIAKIPKWSQSNTLAWADRNACLYLAANASITPKQNKKIR